MDIVKELENIKDLSKDYDKLLANVYYTHFWLTDKYQAILSHYNLTAQQSNVLGVVNHFHPKPLTLTELKNGLLEKNADVSRIVTRLTKKNLLKRATNKENKRKIEITITKEGKALMGKIQSEHLFRKFTSKYTLKEAKQLATLLSKLRVE